METVSTPRVMSEVGSLYLSVTILREEKAALQEMIGRLKAQIEMRDAEILKLNNAVESAGKE